MSESQLEDDRGVDRAAIRERLRLTPQERVDRLIEEVTVWQEILESKRAAGREKDERALPYLESLRDERHPGE